LADLVTVNAIGDDFAPAGQCRQPLANLFRHAADSADDHGGVGIICWLPPHIDQHGRRRYAEPGVEVRGGNRSGQLIHAQSPR
jgi:hypothetical protein